MSPTRLITFFLAFGMATQASAAEMAADAAIYAVVVEQSNEQAGIRHLKRTIACQRQTQMQRGLDDLEQRWDNFRTVSVREAEEAIQQFRNCFNHELRYFTEHSKCTGPRTNPTADCPYELTRLVALTELAQHRLAHLENQQRNPQSRLTNLAYVGALGATLCAAAAAGWNYWH